MPAKRARSLLVSCLPAMCQSRSDRNSLRQKKEPQLPTPLISMMLLRPPLLLKPQRRGRNRRLRLRQRSNLLYLFTNLGPRGCMVPTRVSRGVQSTPLMHTSHSSGTTVFCSKLRVQPMHMLSHHHLEHMDKRRSCTICRLDLRNQAARVKGMRFRRQTSYECRACSPPVALCGPVDTQNELGAADSECFIQWHQR